MSSHHIVRDEQEPALIITDVQKPGKETILQQLEWSPVVVAFEEALEDLITLGIKIDLAVVHPERTQAWEERLTYQQPVQLLTTGEDILRRIMSVISFMRKKEHRTFHLISSNLTVFDYLNLYQQFRRQANLIYFRDTRKIHISETGFFKKWLNAEEQLSFFPVEEPTYIRTSGFTVNPDNELLSTEICLQTAGEGLVTVQTNLKPLVINESLEAN